MSPKPSWKLLSTIAVAFVAIGGPLNAQDAPTLTLQPSAVIAGDAVTATGQGFQPGTVGLYVDLVTGPPVVTAEHRGEFQLVLPTVGIAPGAHRVIACNELARDGSCREQAPASLTIRPVTTTTTTAPPRVSTTTTTAPPRVSTTVVPTTSPQRTSTTTKPPLAPIHIPTTTTTINTIGVPIATPPSPGDLAGPTVAPPVATVEPVVGASIPVGPDPTYDPNPSELAIATTIPPLDVATNIPVGEHPDLAVTAIEVSQGIQNVSSTMPLVADRTTWVRVHVDSAGPGSWAPVDGAMLLQRSGGPDLVVVPENGPIATKQPRTELDSTLNFEVPGAYLAEGALTITTLVWSFEPSMLDTHEPDPANNSMQITVDFHVADVPTIWLVALDDGGGPGPDVTDLDPLLGFAQVVHQDLLDFHPTALVDYQAYPMVVDPGPEALEPGLWDLGLDQDDDADDADADATAGARRHEPNIRMAWLMQDVLDDANVLGRIDSTIPTGGYSGWAGHGVAWNKPNAGTPAHELGHSRGLKHVPCKDADDDGVPDELKGGAIDPLHPTGLPPNCSLAPISPTGYYGLTTERNDLVVYSNDPTDPAAPFPFMSYKNPGWTDPYHWCLLLEEVGVPCNPALIGVPPKVILPAADCSPEPVPGGFGLDLCLIDQLPPPADPIGGNAAPAEPAAPAGTTDYGFQLLCEGAMNSFLRMKINGTDLPAGSWPCGPSAAAGGQYPLGLVAGQLPPGLILVPTEPAAWIVASGSVDLDTGEATIQQLAHRDEIPERNSARWRDAIGEALIKGQPGMAVSLTLVDPAGIVLAHVPVDLDGAGHGDGGERTPSAGFFQAVPAPTECPGCELQLVSASGDVVQRVSISSAEPRVSDLRVADSGDATQVTWSADDPDGDPLTFDVLWSVDGRSWLHAATGMSETTLSVPHAARYPGGDGVRVRVVANDGALSGEATSEPFSAPGHAPRMLVTGVPESGTSEQYEMVLLQAQLLDPEDGIEHDAGLRWHSNAAGDLGAGPVLRTRDLAVGLHTITVAAIDSDGNPASEIFQLEVTPRTSPSRYLETPHPQAVDRLLGAAAIPISEEAAGPADTDGAPTDVVATVAPAPELAASTGGRNTSSLPWIIAALALAGCAAAIGALRLRRAAPCAPRLRRGRLESAEHGAVADRDR